MISSWVPPERLTARGAALRAATPVTELTGTAAGGDPRDRWAAHRGDPVAVLEATAADRVPDLLALRYGRMATSPFAFLRGAAAVMAADLATLPDTGLHGHICGDAHAANFGLYASPERRLVLDVNDFDEAAVGPWDWDLKRLVASVVCAGRQAGVGDGAARLAARDCAAGYRRALGELAAMPLLEAYYLTTDQSTLARHGVDDLAETFDRVRKKARKNTSRRVVDKFTTRLERDALRFVENPPLLTRPPAAEAELVVAALEEYRGTLDEEIRTLIGRYAVVDVAHRVVGLGSVGYRSYVVLLHGNADEALVLQVKQARASVLAEHLPQPPSAHNGERAIRGQRWMQTVSDILLGWTTIDGRPFLVRQFRDMKGGIDPTELRADQLDDYARMVGVVLARAHAQSIDPRILAGYCDGPAGDVSGAGGAGGAEFDEAFAAFAVAYADQTEADHAALLAALDTGRLPPPAPR
jgi:uncharacterized protein (DUF2252 family)